MDFLQSVSSCCLCSDRKLNRVDPPRTYSPYDAPIRDWGRVLDLAHKWSFQEVKHLALRELEKLTIPIIARICLYEKYEVDLNLLVPLYAKLCSRDTILTLQETEALGLKTSHIIFLGRERLRAQTPDRSPLPPGADEESVKVTIEILLGIRLEEDQSGGTANITGGWVITTYPLFFRPSF